MRKRELKNMEWGILIAAIILSIIGMVALFSATQETEYDDFKKQLQKNPPINEKMIKAMMSGMGRTPSQKQVNQMMKSMKKYM